MHPHILLFYSGNRHDQDIADRLALIPARLVRTRSLSRMLDLLPSSKFLAVVVNRDFIADRRLMMHEHLQETPIAAGIVVYHREDSGLYRTTVYCSPEESGDDPVPPVRAELLDAICAAIESPFAPRFTPGADKKREKTCRSRTTSPRTADPGERFPVDLPPGTEDRLHRKLKILLAHLSAAGKLGIDIRSLDLALWTDSREDHRKDIQIYVSKLRKFFSTQLGNRYAIVWNDRRYYLVERQSASVTPHHPDVK